MSKIDKYLGENVVPKHHQLMKKAKNTMNEKGAIEQLMKVGATKYKGNLIVAQYHIFDPNGDREISSPCSTWKETVNQCEYYNKEVLKFMGDRR